MMEERKQSFGQKSDKEHESERELTLIFIRHGETAGNAQKRYIGKTDVPLSKAGKSALRALRHEYEDKGFIDDDVCPFVVVSPMRRCIQSAEILFPLVVPFPVRKFCEIDFGLFEGKNYDELMADETLKVEYQKWIDSNGEAPFPGGESKAEFIERIKAGFADFLEMIRTRGCHTATAIVHGGTIMALMSSFCGGSFYDYQVKNGHGFICTLDLAAYTRGDTGAMSILQRF